MSGGTVLIRLQNLAWSANASDIRRFFNGLAIPEGGVHIVGGDRGDAFVTFTSDETARLALLLDGQELCGQTLKLFVSSTAEMQHVVQQARLAVAAPTDEPQPPTTPTPPLLREQHDQRLAEHHDSGYGRTGQRAYPRQRYYPETDAGQRMAGGRRPPPPRHFPSDTAVAAYGDEDAAVGFAVPPEKRQRLDRGGDGGPYYNEGGYGRNSGRGGGGYGQAAYRRFYDDRQQQPHPMRHQSTWPQQQQQQRHSNGTQSGFNDQHHRQQPYQRSREDNNGDYGSSSARHSRNNANYAEDDYSWGRDGGNSVWDERHGGDWSEGRDADERGGGGGGPAALNAYSNIYSGQQQLPPPSSGLSTPAPGYSSSRDPRLAGRYRRESADAAGSGPRPVEAADNEAASAARPSFYNEQRDPRFKGELYGASSARSRVADGESANAHGHAAKQQPPIGSVSTDRGLPSRERYEGEDEGYEYYRAEHGHQRGGRRGFYPPRPGFDGYGGGSEAEFGESGGRRPRQFDSQEWGEDADFEPMGGAGFHRGGGPPAQRGWRGRGRGRGGPGGPSNGYPPPPYAEGGGYRPKPWMSAGGPSGFQLLPQPPVGDDEAVAAAFCRLLHPNRPKSLLGPAPNGPPSNRRPEAQAADDDAVAAAEAGDALSRPTEPCQPAPMPQLPQDGLPDYTKGPRDEHFVVLAGLPLDADYSDACAALPGIRLALSDVKFETDALGRRTGQAFARLVEPADVLRALSQSGTDDNGKVRVGASCEHEFRCANDPDFTGDVDDPDIGGGSGGLEFPDRPSPYYLDCCLEVNGLPQPIVAEDLLTVFGGDRAIADPAEDVHLDRSKDPNSVAAYLRFDGFERFAEASRRDVTQLAPGAYLCAISRLQFANYRAASLRCGGDAGGGENEDDEEEECKASRAIDFRLPPIGFQQQQQQQIAAVKQKNLHFKKQKKLEKSSAINKTDDAAE